MFFLADTSTTVAYGTHAMKTFGTLVTPLDQIIMIVSCLLST